MKPISDWDAIDSIFQIKCLLHTVENNLQLQIDSPSLPLDGNPPPRVLYYVNFFVEETFFRENVLGTSNNSHLEPRGSPLTALPSLVGEKSSNSSF